MTVRAWLTCVGLTLVVGIGLGYWLHGSPAPSPPVQVAQHHADTAIAVAAKAEAIADTSNHLATKALVHYDTARKHDTVVVNSVVYVPAAPADSVARACADAIPKDSTAIAKKDTAIVAVQTVVTTIAAEHPSRLRELVKDVALLGVGYTAGRLQIGVRIPF